MKKAIIFCALLAAFMTTASAEDLIDIYNLAKQRDPVIAEARAQLEAQRTQTGQARGGLLPQLGLTANTRWNHVDSDLNGTPPAELEPFVGNGGSSEYNTNGYALQLTQPLFDVQAFANFQQSKDVVKQAELQFALAQQQLLLRVATAYFNVLQARDNLRVARAEQKALLEQLNQAKRRFQVGTASATDRDAAQAQFDLARSSAIAARNQLAIAREQLQRIIGQRVADLATLKKNIPMEEPQPADMQTWVDQARQANLQVLASRAGVEISRGALSTTKGTRYPTLDIVASHGRQKGRQFGLDQTTTSDVIGLQLNWDIFSGGTRYYQIKQAAAEVTQSESSLVDSIRGAALNASQAYLEVQNSVSQVQALTQALRSSQTSLQSTRVGQEVGTRTFVDVLNALEQVFSAQSNLLQARYTYLTNRLQLKAAVGELSIDNLQTINSMLTSEKEEELPGAESMPGGGE